MTNKTDNTKDLLENILSNIYKEQAEETTKTGLSYLMDQDNQYLGKITANIYDINSILNQYGPYGSKYINISIFNDYSQYGSVYGAYSINNSYCSVPPKLIINRRFITHISNNVYVSPKITPDVFIYNLNNNLAGLIGGDIIESDLDLKIRNRESFLLAGDGIFIGSLNPNTLANDSIFNKLGPYGSVFSQTSIYNNFSPYGGQLGVYSPFNQLSNNPPKIYLKGRHVGFLTKNIL